VGGEGDEDQEQQPAKAVARAPNERELQKRIRQTSGRTF
jgi:hypothetical protein